MRVLLITPPFDFLKEGYGSKIGIKCGNLPALGLCHIASCLERAGHEVSILDAQAMSLSEKNIVKKSFKYKPDMIGVGITNGNYSSAKKLIPLLKREIKAPTICGGPHVTRFHKKILKEIKDVDIAVIGEGEYTVTELADAFEKNAPISNIKGIAYRNGNKIRINKGRELLRELDKLPLLPWHLLDFKLYSPLPDQYKRLPAISMVTSRGAGGENVLFVFKRENIKCFIGGILQKGL